jgi:hypothetical protein
MSRLSLDAFKTKAENVNTNEVLEKVQGGNWYDCHGCDGTWAKVKDYLKEAAQSDPLPYPYPN